MSRNTKISIDEIKPFPILDLPQSVRVRVWKLLGFSHTKTLRLVSSEVKDDIDTVTGISSAIDSTYLDFAFHCKTAIRKVAIHELVFPSYVEFLKYPLVLTELEIRGEISIPNFNYIITSCPNLSRLVIVFNKFVIDQKVPMFPLTSTPTTHRPLSRLHSFEIISSTKKITDLAYVYRNVMCLIKDVLKDAKVSSVHIMMIHKSTSVYIQEMLWSTLVLLHKNASILRYVNITFKDKDPHAAEETSESSSKPNEAEQKAASAPAPSQNAQSNAQPGHRRGAGSKDQTNTQPTLRRDTVVPGVVITVHDKDIHKEDASTSAGVVTTSDDIGLSTETEGEADVSNDDSEETNDAISVSIKYLEQNPWETAKLLTHLTLVVPVKALVYILKIVSKDTPLKKLSLDTVGLTQQTWSVYKQFVEQCNPANLMVVKFLGVTHSKSEGQSLPLDASIFKKCKKLQNLTIFCRRRDDLSKCSRLTNISSLSTTLEEIALERVLLKPFQMFRLLFCFSKMYSVTVAYWSISDRQFAFTLCLMKWIIMLNLMDVQKINMVDTKIRFTNERKSVRKLQNGVDISVTYSDLDETKLQFDAHAKQDTARFAPRPSLAKIPTPHAVRRRVAPMPNSASTTTIA